MNVFDYFRTQPAVPVHERSRFWRRADGLMRQAGLDAQGRRRVITDCEAAFEKGQDEADVLTGLQAGLPAFSLKRELSDLPLFLAVYAGGLEGIYEQVLVPLGHGQPARWQMPVSLGLLAQCAWVYVIMKGLLRLLAFEAPGPKYWAGIILLFAGYLAGIWLCSFLDGTVLFSIPVVLAVLLPGGLALLVWKLERRT